MAMCFIHMREHRQCKQAREWRRRHHLLQDWSCFSWTCKPFLCCTAFASAIAAGEMAAVVAAAFPSWLLQLWTPFLVVFLLWLISETHYRYVEFLCGYINVCMRERKTTCAWENNIHAPSLFIAFSGTKMPLELYY